jgi:hypothetical protein
MCKTTRDSFAHAFRKKIETSDLAAPTIPISDPIDGLIKTQDLESDVEVDILIWDGPLVKDQLQLTVDRTKVGQIYTFASIPAPGSILTLKIPVDTQLQVDKTYQIGYAFRTYPGNNDVNSMVAEIKVDRTAPGAHQLGYMDFPEEAKDGLTAVELSAMGDVLTGRIYGYSDLDGGDIIQTYWGDTPGPTLSIIGDEDEDQPLEIAFSKAFLLALEKNPGATTYTVTDRAGNTSARSKPVTIPLFLTEVTPDLPAPEIENYDGLIDYNDSINRVEVKIPNSTVPEEGDSVMLHWGSIDVGPFAIHTDDLPEPYIMVFNVSAETIEQAGNGTLALRYDILREGNVVGTSLSFDIDVNTRRPVPSPLDRPTIKGGSNLPSAEDNVIDENDFELNATVIINWNTQFQPGQHITVYWGGTEVLERAYTLTNSDVAAGRALLLTALKDKFSAIGTGPDIRVYYTVTEDGNPNISSSPEQGIIVRSKEELPGGAAGLDAPEFLNLNENGAISPITAPNGTDVYVKPYVNAAPGQTIVFTYNAYDLLVDGMLLFTWTHISPELTENEVNNGYRFTVPKDRLVAHCFGHVEANFKVQSTEIGNATSRTANAYVDMRTGSRC